MSIVRYFRTVRLGLVVVVVACWQTGQTGHQMVAVEVAAVVDQKLRILGLELEDN